MVVAPQLTPKDYASDQNVRWCPGCGDYSILAQMKKVLADLQIERENTVFVSGIGCSSRFPYYMNTYGIHSIHGRAPAIATGLKLARPELNVFVITGDGDGLSIGGNHLMHAIRRNLDITIILFNNRIYGLTKGQVSPTSEFGKKTKTTPLGSVDNPVNPLSLALGVEATFVARSIDVHVKHLQETLKRAIQHKGTSFLEIYQNCNIFNDGAYVALTDKNVKYDNVLEMEHGKPMRFGRNGEKGLRRNGFTVEIVNCDEVPESELIVHNEQFTDPGYAFMLSRLKYPDFPEPIGVFRDVEAPVYDQMMHEQIEKAGGRNGKSNDLHSLLYTGELWEVT
ncbi:MAG: 2-oxoacid:ferredoxin oxidoreductase subunit beta [bacterium]|jgi:2-oxoglutarate ferredoxin oxidoreductase subunit beta